MSSVRCPVCNLTNWSTAVACKRCGNFLQPGGDATVAAPQEFQPDLSAQNGLIGENQSQNQHSFSAADQQAGGQVNHSYSEPPNYQAAHDFQYQPTDYQYRQPANLKSGLAIASMITGILGFVTMIFLVGVLIAPVGVVLGIIALIKINRQPRVYGGKGFAIAGIATGGIVVLFVPIILAIAVPNFLAARRAANEASAISTLRTITGAQTTYMASTYGKCGDVQTLIATKLLDVSLANGEKNGYRFLVVTLPAGGCEIHATPVSNSYGSRSFFYSTKDGVIRGGAKKGLPADKTDLPLGGGGSSEKWES